MKFETFYYFTFVLPLTILCALLATRGAWVAFTNAMRKAEPPHDA